MKFRAPGLDDENQHLRINDSHFVADFLAFLITINKDNNEWLCISYLCLRTIGPGSESFSGMYEKTAIFNKMMTAFGFDY